MHPVLFSVDFFGLLKEPVSLHVYGLLIAMGFLLAMQLAARQAGREGEEPDRIIDLSFYLLIWGLVGSRLVFIFTKLPQYMANPQEIVMFWKGGLVFYGGFIGAAVYLIYFARKYQVDYFKIVDIMIPYVAMAHAFGRLGCLAAGCCFGKPTEAPWGVIFPVASMAQQQQQSQGLVGFDSSALPVHPTQLYEAGFELLMFWLLLSLRPHKRFHGQLFLVWLAVYPVVRSFIELFRGDKERGIYGFLSTSQYISIGVAVTAAVVYFFLRNRRRGGDAAIAAA
ncbi:MAG: prolipoprotein diacylglyceryl transferase [Clostridia bacterium]|nr:prolipoprotein diacylglyceryl transferase [Deltaproteobacteria bacterium]